MSDMQTKLLWYKVPAENWIEALPIGNGRLGAMLYGGANRDLISLNEDSIWEGKPMDKLNPKGLATLPRIREFLFEGRLKEAVQLGTKTMVSIPRHPFSYQTLGDLIIENRQSRIYSNYRRELDLSTGIGKVSFDMDGTHYSREYFVSAIDQVIALRCSCDKPGKININVGFTRKENGKGSYAGDKGILLEGWGDPEGIFFAALLKMVIEPSGDLLPDRKDEVSRSCGIHHLGYPDQLIDYPVISLYSADQVTFYIAATTTFRYKDPAAEAAAAIERAQEKGWDKIRSDHIADYQRLFNRFEIQLSSGASRSEVSDRDTMERVEAVRTGAIDPEFFTLYSNYCRYLLISDSRPGCLPANLQGIWNHKLHAPWESDYHTNVNFQINYWPVEAYNLAECHKPVFDWLERMVPFGADTAKRLYGARGWVLHHCTDIWGVSSPIFSLIGVWPMGALWCCRDLYEYYLHTLDLPLIRDKGYGILKGAVEFMLDFLVEAPANTPWAGCLVTNPSHSPENHYYTEDGTEADFTWAATMDLEIIRDLFGICIRFIDAIAKEQPGFEGEFRAKVEEAIKRLPSVQISPKTGGIQEWIYDYDEVEPGHRHVSHLYAVYPGFQITPERTPTLAEAAAKSIYRRYAHGYDGQGWSMGWIANIWARLRNPEEAYASLKDIAEKHILCNLFINSHGNPQVGDMQAAGAAILECLAQSHDETIRLLPALPAAWPNGMVRGMKLRGGHELVMNWEKGKLKYAKITALSGGAVNMPILFPEQEQYRITTERNGVVIQRL
jgi:alpha-L-fucosidase 2